MPITKLPVTKIVVASHNSGKVREIRDLLRPFGVETLSAGELGIPEPVENGTSFAENAEIKARACADASGLPSLSDDSGFSVDALDGAPGIYAADWAELPRSEAEWSGQRRDFLMAMWHVQQRLEAAGVCPGSPEATARFTCALCMVEPGRPARTYQGTCEGRVVWPPRGSRGFGYDPIFIADGDVRTFGEISPEEKHGKSHRAAAFAAFVAAEFGGS